MRILSFDIGFRNLGYSLIELKTRTQKYNLKELIVENNMDLIDFGTIDCLKKKFKECSKKYINDCLWEVFYLLSKKLNISKKNMLDILLIEKQPRVLNSIAFGCQSKIEVLFSPYSKQLVIINATLKNKIDLSDIFNMEEKLSLSYFLSINKTTRTARKKHTATNFKFYLDYKKKSSILVTKKIKGIKIRDCADAFFQSIAYILYKLD